MDDDPWDNLIYICCKTLKELNDFVFENNINIDDEVVKKHRNQLSQNDVWLQDKLSKFSEPCDVDEFERENPLLRGLPSLLKRKRQLKLEQVRNKTIHKWLIKKITQITYFSCYVVTAQENFQRNGAVTDI